MKPALVKIERFYVQCSHDECDNTVEALNESKGFESMKEAFERADVDWGWWVDSFQNLALCPQHHLEKTKARGGIGWKLKPKKSS